jgi:hypothetical protein
LKLGSSSSSSGEEKINFRYIVKSKSTAPSSGVKAGYSHHKELHVFGKTALPKLISRYTRNCYYSLLNKYTLFNFITLYYLYLMCTIEIFLPTMASGIP